MSQKHDIENSLGFLLHNAARAVKRQFEMHAAMLGLTSAQWRVLVQLIVNGSLPQARLAEALEIEPISVSRIVDRMQEGGWVDRHADPNDRRIRIITPTPRAEAAFEDARKMADTVYAQAFKGVSEADQSALRHTLSLIITNLAQPTNTAPSEPHNDN
ncbi:MarR family winged helix-turn-helix transcriptional regulator [Albirhodobacter sp. R86504]|jgi:DNA-binding MarR family transcriptional regulator|uniref:MarR family winged helix-turn-helix transcriptional regulator n=1 Tax=Albirhodobacter sp. R86504 TaxID=3093848 RepID=UPI00366B4BD4